ncbi:MAG: preprotein translocase subunit SecG [Alphaproteobacteria bacterium]|nr:preprotein translocase subunit SecG [Alphaproteobacteria bacterium]
MTAVIIVIHLILAIALVGVILLQRSEGGGLGMGGGGGGMGGFMTGRAAANMLTRATAVIAALFMLTSLSLAILAGGDRESRSILDQPPAPVEQEPAEPEGPSAPLAR